MKHHTVKNEISIDDKLQSAVQEVIDKYIDKSDNILDTLINYFTKISYHLPAIYNVTINTYEWQPTITFQSHRTNGFIFRITNGIKYDYSKNSQSLDSVFFLIDNCETHDKWTTGRVYLSIYDINKDSYYFKMAIKYLEAIMRNTTVAMYLSKKYPFERKFLFDDKYFTEEGIKIATEYCKKYFYFKRIKQQFSNRIDNSFINIFYKIAKQYNNDIYEMAYKIDHWNSNLVTIKTRAKLFYGDNAKYNQFEREIYSLFYDNFDRIMADIDACEKESPDDFQDSSEFYSKPIICIDGIDNDGYYCPYNRLSCKYLYIKYPKLEREYKDIIFPKRSR